MHERNLARLCIAMLFLTLCAAIIFPLPKPVELVPVVTNRDHKDARICVTSLDVDGQPTGSTVCATAKAAR